MRDQLKRLEDLQKHDAKIQELENLLKTIPQKIQATQLDLQRVEALLTGERGSLAETEKYYADQRSLMQDDEIQVAGAKHKLSQAKNSKEYMAAQREIDQKRESLTARQGEIQKLVDAIEAKKKLLEQKAADVQALRESIGRDEETSRAKMAEIDGQIAVLRVERGSLAAGIKPDVLKRYGSIRMRRGLAVVAVRNGACGGCNMNLPPQLYIQLQRGITLETCPSCHRIIYWEDLMKDPAAATPPSAESKSA